MTSLDAAHAATRPTIANATALANVALVIVGVADPISVAIVESSPAPLARSLSTATLPAVSLCAAKLLAVPASALRDRIGGRCYRVFCALADAIEINNSGE